MVAPLAEKADRIVKALAWAREKAGDAERDDAWDELDDLHSDWTHRAQVLREQGL